MLLDGEAIAEEYGDGVLAVLLDEAKQGCTKRASHLEHESGLRLDNHLDQRLKQRLRFDEKIKALETRFHKGLKN